MCIAELRRKFKNGAGVVDVVEDFEKHKRTSFGLQGNPMGFT